MEDKMIKKESIRDEIAFLRGENERLRKELANYDLFYHKIGKIGHWENNIINTKTKWSEKTFAIFGYKPNEDEPHEIFSRHIHPEDKEEYWNTIKDFFSSDKKEISPIYVRIIDKNNQCRDISVQGMFETDSKGNKIKVYGTIQDITEQFNIQKELRDNTKQLEMLFDNMNEAFGLHEIILDKDGKPVDYRYIDINPAFEKLTGLKKTEVIGKCVKQILPKIEKYWIDIYGKVALSGEGVHFTNYVKEFDKYYKVKAYSPKPGFFAVTFADITDRQKAELKLKESEERFRLIIEHAADAVYLCDMKGNIIDCNQKACSLLGFKRKELLQKTVMELDANYPSLEECLVIWNKLEKKKSYSFEGRHIQKDGTTIPVEINTSSIQLNGEKHILGFVRDIRARRKNLELIKKLSTAVIQSPVAIVITDIEGTIEFVNPQFTKVTGYSFKEAIGQNPRILKTEHTTVEEYKEMWDTILQGKIWKGEFYNKRKDGTCFWELATIAPIIEENGNSIGFIAVKENITERKKSMEALKNSEQRLAEANTTKDRLFSIIGHDLKNPIGSIISYGELINSSLQNQKYDSLEKHVKMLTRSAEQSYNLLINLLDWARNQIGSIAFNPRELLLFEIVSEIMSLLDGSAENKEILIKNEVQKDLQIFADVTMLDTIIRNLISNAIKFTPKKGIIEIGSRGDDDNVLLWVKDTGVGIEPERLKKIFAIEKSKSTPGTDKEEGTGLGLILCHDFVEKHNGKIWVDSKVNKGTIFYVQLPKK